MKKILKSLGKYSILNLCLVACATGPVDTKFDANWNFTQPTQKISHSYLQCVPADRPDNEKTHACLIEEDIKRLRELLIRCRSKE